MDIIKSIEHEQMKNKIPKLKVGDTVKVHVRVKEGSRERIQVFEGIIIKIQGGGVNQTFTARRISYGVGVEKTFLIHSPKVEKIEVVRVGKARRAKLFYLRDRIGKSAKTKEKVGAKIETQEITIKEEVAVEPEVPTDGAVEEEIVPAVEAPVEEVVAEEPKAEETPAVEEPVAEVVEEPVAEPVVEEETVEETPSVAEEPAAEAPEEAPSVETEEPVVEETIDTVSEEAVETVSEEPEKKTEE